jgi:selenoprotein W-related protein
VSVQLIPSSGGRFEVTVDDHLVYSKAATGRHPEPGQVLRRIKEVRGEK